MATVEDLLRSGGAVPSGDATLSSPKPGSSRRTWRMRALATAMAGFALAVTLGLLIADQLSERGRFDRAQKSLTSTQSDVVTVSADLATLRQDLTVLTSQVGSDTTALNQDASQLQGAQAALAAADAHVQEQSSQITSLHTCLGGVERALNVLSVGTQSQAFALLVSVSSSCTAAAALSG